MQQNVLECFMRCVALYSCDPSGSPVCVRVCVIGMGGIPVFLCLSKQSKAVSGGNAGKY